MKRCFCPNIRQLGTQPGPALRRILNDSLTKREPDEVIVVHHFTDWDGILQLEVERRSATLGIAFERIRLPQ